VRAKRESRAQQLAQRRARLRAQCELQRRELRSQAAQIEEHLAGIDRAVAIVRGVTAKPVAISIAIATLVLIGPKRALRWVTKGAVWYSTGKRLLGLIAQVKERYALYASQSPEPSELSHRSRRALR